MRKLIALAMLAACTTPIDGGSDDETAAGGIDVSTDFAKPNLAPGDVKVWSFTGTASKDGIDSRFKKKSVKNAVNVSFKQGQDQRITMKGDGQGQADIQLEIADIQVTGGGDHYYKGWLFGNVLDSTNKAIGFCGNGGFDKGDFHTQLQMAFEGPGGNLGLCYCNICPAKDGHGSWCMTDQWQTPTDDPPRVSVDGACKAPAATTHVVVTLEAVAKDKNPNPNHGTAVFKKVAVGRCSNDGQCPEAMVPNDYGKN
ncbi:MAG TPA: hypothetical protein VGC41_21860 [Kofleriaceae bacterium]